jgi:hypothetical protein
MPWRAAKSTSPWFGARSPAILQQREPVPLTVTPVASAFDPPRFPMTFDIGMGVRKGDTAFGDVINAELDRNRAAIDGLLDAYHIPLLPPLAESSSKPRAFWRYVSNASLPADRLDRQFCCKTVHQIICNA